MMNNHQPKNKQNKQKATLEPTKKDMPHPKTKKKPQEGRRGTNAIKSKCQSH